MGCDSCSVMSDGWQPPALRVCKYFMRLHHAPFSHPLTHSSTHPWHEGGGGGSGGRGRCLVLHGVSVLQLVGDKWR